MACLGSRQLIGGVDGKERIELLPAQRAPLGHAVAERCVFQGCNPDFGWRTIAGEF